MQRAFALLLALMAVLGMLRLTAACLDTTPIFVEAEAGPDSGTACLTCVEQRDGGCGPLVQVCEDSARCSPVLACIRRDGCFDRPTVDSKVKCGLPCAVDSGITDLNDEVVQTHLVGLIGYLQTTCAAPCNAGDASLGL